MYERGCPSGSVGAAFLSLALAACVSDSPVTTADSGTNDGSAVDAATEAAVDAGPCSGKTLCGSDGGPTTCADLTSDPNNCGTCGHFCPSKACANGDCVRRVFVSSSTTTGEGGGVTGSGGLDFSCQQLALAVGLDGKYMAWLSSDVTSPSSRFTKSKAPYVRTDGTKVANDWTGLTSGTLLVPINRDEKATVVSTSTDVWTDTDTNGTEIGTGSNCKAWTSTIPSSLLGSYGHATATDATWTNAAAIVCTASNRFYCVEQ